MNNLINNISIYLAGPDVFRTNAFDHGVALKLQCAEYGFTGLYPFDNEVDFDLPKAELRRAIYKGNVSFIDQCDVVIANLTPFRGDSADVGTVWEIARATAKGKLVIGYTNSTADYKDRVEASGNTDSLFPNVEDFGAFENLMIAESIDYLVGSFDEALELLSTLQLQAA